MPTDAINCSQYILMSLVKLVVKEMIWIIGVIRIVLIVKGIIRIMLAADGETRFHIIIKGVTCIRGQTWVMLIHVVRCLINPKGVVWIMLIV